MSTGLANSSIVGTCVELRRELTMWLTVMVVSERISQVIWLTDLAKGGGSCAYNNMPAKVVVSAMTDGL